MNLVLVNQFFPPARAPTGWLLRDLAGELAGRGHAVTVIASPAGCGPGAVADPHPAAGVRVVRVGPARPPRPGIVSKLRDYLAFHRGVRAELARGSAAADALVCMTTPPLVGWHAARLRERRGVPYALWCMDLYPEALRAGGWLNEANPVMRGLRAAAHGERTRASFVVALGPDMARRLADSGAGRVVEIPVWSRLSPTGELAGAARGMRLARGWAPDEIVLLYSGNMGRAHRAEEFADLAGLLRAAGIRARFVFAGTGPRRAEWERRWRGVLEFLPPVPEAETAAHLAAADVHLVSQQPGWEGVVVPSKFQAACALGRPVVFAGPPRSAVGEWLAESDAGWGLLPGRSPAGAVAELGDAAVRAAKGRRARALFERRFTPAANCAKLADMVESLLPPTP